ncbi:leucine-rich repeat-containing protein 75B [Ambystoma mexicanum]|uniref:leucine-rich repeat-containing protein 75B n=1 Tax=Ambystoma mexicanum TaxID=8296 RepID=UPI0037E93168
MGGRLSRQSSLEEGEGQPPNTEGEPHGHFNLTSLIISPDRLPEVLRRSSPAPYVRRVAWLREIQALLRDQKKERAYHILRQLRKDLGLEGSLLKDILYRHATFLNLVDPISHELLMSLARDLQCPKKDHDPLKSTDRICRQLIYHLTPHSKWHRHSVPRRKSQACLKAGLQKMVRSDSLDLSGIPLSTRDAHRIAYYLQHHGENLTAIDMSFTELTDDAVALLLPTLASLPKLTHLALNGNRLTKATMKDLTDAIKDAVKFPFLAWVDLGNNVDVSSMPQPLLVGLRRRLCQQTTLPTIYESPDGDGQAAARSGQQPLKEEQWEAGHLCSEGGRQDSTYSLPFETCQR